MVCISSQENIENWSELNFMSTSYISSLDLVLKAREAGHVIGEHIVETLQSQLFGFFLGLLWKIAFHSQKREPLLLG